jgi:hypothetical protein
MAIYCWELLEKKVNQEGVSQEIKIKKGIKSKEKQNMNQEECK